MPKLNQMLILFTFSRKYKILIIGFILLFSLFFYLVYSFINMKRSTNKVEIKTNAGS